MTDTLSAALLLGFALVVLLGHPLPNRLRLLRPTHAADPDRTLSPAFVRLACGLAAAATWWLAGGLVGGLLGLGVFLLGPPALERMDAQRDEEGLAAADLPLALDLVAACLAGGAVAVHAVRAVSVAVPGPCGDRLAAVAARLDVGVPAAEAWRSLGHDRGPAGAAARAMSRAAEGGAPVAAAVQRVADDARRESAARDQLAARRAGVLAVAPLGLCFLPAFLLLGVVPAVIGLAAPLMSSL